MKIVKEIRSLHPTVQYGNIEIFGRYEYDSETDTLSKEERIKYGKIDNYLNRVAVEAWTGLYDEIEAKVKPKLGVLRPNDKAKGQSEVVKKVPGKDKISRPGRR
jgi:hypothetical protein